MAGWHHWLDRCEFEWTPGVGDGQGGLVCCNSWGRKELDTTERLHFHFSLFTFMHWRRKWQPTPLFLPGESQGQECLVGCHLWVTQSWTQLKQLNSSSSNREAWHAVIHGVTKSRTWLSDWTELNWFHYSLYIDFFISSRSLIKLSCIISILPPSSLLCITLWTSLSDPDCGLCIRKWLLASLLAPLLILPHLILVPSICLLPLLFSM